MSDDHRSHPQSVGQISTSAQPQRRVFVTGGARGIGAEIAEHFLRCGYTVGVGDMDRDGLSRFEDRTGVHGMALNVADFPSTQTTIDDFASKHGSIDIVINNAGITRDGMIHKMDPATQWQAVIDVNLTGVFNVCRACIPSMRENGFGRIINISSMNGLRGQLGQANYSAAKAGVIGLTKAIAQEVAAKGITANCIAPGFIETEMTRQMPTAVLESETEKIPVGRMGLPSDIAAIAVFLASDAASFITGQTVSSNGGQLMP